jgi:hypothetical protein
MASDFPTSAPNSKTDFDSDTNVASSYQNAQGEDINAIAAKVGHGTDNNAPAENKILRGTGAGTSEWDKDCPTGDIVGTTDTQTLSNKTITSPVVNTGFSGTAKASGAEIDTGTEDAKIVTPKAIADSLIQTGWTPARETWEYASETTITVPSGAEDKYQKGDKIKLTQTTVKYFYIISVADTVLTVTGGTDYTVADAAITDNYYSHQENPIGFPHWFSWTPSYDAGGSMTFDSVSTEAAVFKIMGTSCEAYVRGNGTTGGSASRTLRATPPVDLNTAVCDTQKNGAASCLDPKAVAGMGWIDTRINCRRYDNANFGIGAGRRMEVSVIYPY